MIRQQEDWTPVLMLTARDAELDKVSGLEAGVDDYITKPFDSEVLLLKIKAILKRNEELNKELSSTLQKAEGKLDGLRKRFSQIDIVREAQAEPDKMAERINRAVDRLREELMNETSTVDSSSNTDSE